MSMKNLTLILAFIGLLFTSCKESAPQIEKRENVSLAISGMTCEIGCAKTIESKLSKKEGVINAKVAFKDSLATIEYDANKTSKEDLIAFVDGIAGGDLYKASESTKKAKEHTCTEACKKECEMKEKKECKADCKMAGCTKESTTETK